MTVTPRKEISPRRMPRDSIKGVGKASQVVPLKK